MYLTRDLVFIQNNPTWTIIQTIVSPHHGKGQDSILPALFQVPGREKHRDRTEIESTYKEKITIEDPLFLYLDTFWDTNRDCRIKQMKLNGYVYNISEEPAIMMRYIFSWTVELFTKLVTQSEITSNGTRQYRFVFPEGPSRAKANLLQAMVAELASLDPNSRLRVLLEKHFPIKEIGDILIDLTGPILQCRNYDQVGSSFGSAFGAIAVIIAECARYVDPNMRKPLMDDITRDLERSRYGQGTDMDIGTIHVDYMTAGGYENGEGTRFFHLDHRIFYNNKLNVLIGEAFDSKVSGNIPVPRPNVSLRPDWAIKLRGATIVTGEAKSEDSTITGMGATAVTSAQQFAYSDTAVFVFMTNKKIRIAEMTCQDRHTDPSQAKTTLDAVMYDSPLEMDFLPRRHRDPDPDDNTKLLPLFKTDKENGSPQPTFNGPQTRGAFSQENFLQIPLPVVRKYEKLHPQLRTILIAVFESANVLANAILRKGDLDKIEERYNACLQNNTLQEARYVPLSQGVQRRVIYLQNMWKYSEQSRRAWSEFISPTEASRIRDGVRVVYSPENVIDPSDEALQKIKELQKINEEMGNDAEKAFHDTQEDILERHVDKMPRSSEYCN